MIPIPFRTSRNTPDPGAVYLTSLLCTALYHADREPFDMYASMVGGTVVHFDADKATFEPDVGIIRIANDHLAIMDGTTNVPQWAAHAASSYWPNGDEFVPLVGGGHPFAFGSTVVGLTRVQNVIDAAIAPIGRGKVSIAGHSYGGGAAFAWGRRLANGIVAPTEIEILTFGEPRTYDKRPAVREPDWHARIIAKTLSYGDRESLNQGVDPVTLCPPAQLTFIRLPLVIDVIFFLAGLGWQHYGDPYLLSPLGITTGDRTTLLDQPFVETLNIADNLRNAAMHYIDVSYMMLARQNWQLSGQHPELRDFDRFYVQYVGHPFQPADVTGPEIEPVVLNTQFFGNPAGPVTRENLPEWETISASGYFLSATTIGGSDTMTRMKGTVGFNSRQGSFSESVYAMDTNTNVQQMLEKMQQWLVLRARLSITDKSDACLNPILPTFIRAQDELLSRDGQTISLAPKTFAGFTSSSASRRLFASEQNLPLQLGARINYIGGGPQQSVFITHHGLPEFAYDTPEAGTEDVAESVLRNLSPNAAWLTWLNALVAYMATAGLGYRSIAGAWNVDNEPGPYAAPDSVHYNTAMQMVELQWVSIGASPNPPYFPTLLAGQAPANWPNINSQCRLQVRRWKNFAVLQGRWAAQVVTPQAGNNFALRILRKVRAPQTADVPFVSPVAWSYWFPGQFLTPVNTVPTGTPPQPNSDAVKKAGRFVLVESKKLGKNFDAQRGRQRNRPT